MSSLKLLCTLLFCCITTISFSQIDSIEFGNIQFGHLDKKSGLPNDMVWKVFQDSKGFTWIGTHDGLTRWDGLNFRHFQPNPADSTAIMGTMIMDITEDKDGYIWVLVHNKGLARFDPNTDTFKNFRHQPYLKGLMRMKNFEDGYLWLGCYGSGMFRYEIATDSVITLPLKPHFDDDEDMSRLNSIVDIAQDINDNNILWCAGNDGLYKLNKTTLTFDYFKSPAEGTALMTISGVLMDEPDKLWLSAYGGGLIEFDIPSASWKYHIYIKPNFKNYDGKGFSDVVNAVIRKSPDEFWVQTQDRGPGIFNIPSGKFTFFQPDSHNPVAISAGIGNRLFKDKEDKIWFTFYNTGVSYINPECQAFFNVPLNLKSCGDQFSKNNVTDFGFDATTGKIYAAANGCSGLFEINPNDWSSKPIHTLGMGDAYQIFMALLVTKNGDVWVGGESDKGGETKEVKRPSLLYLDKQKNKLVPFDNEATRKIALQQRNISDIKEGDNGTIWAAANDGALIEINPNTKAVHAYSINEQDTTVQRQIRQIIYDQEIIWVATSKGVFTFDVETHRYDLVKVTTDFEVNTFAKDKDGVLWIGTMQNGLKKLSIEMGSIATPDASNLPYTLIDKITIGKENELWLSTQSGLYFLDKSVKTHRDGHFQVYNKEDGLVFNSFYLHGFMTLPDGTLLLGQHNQFYHVLPECLTNPKTVKPVYLTSFQLLGKGESTPIQKLDKVELDYDENFFTIYFSSLTYCQANKVQFTYKMEGLDKDWTTTNLGEFYQNYTKLDAGNYTFKIHRTGFAEDEQQLQITIHPPIWLTTGAYILYGLLGFGILFGIYSFQLKKQRIEQEAKQLKEIDAFKTKTYTDISHEIRSPLTLIMGLSEQMLNENIGDVLRRKLEGVINNGNRILQLVNRILDLRKLETNKYQLKIIQREITGLLKHVGYNFEPIILDKGIKLEKSIEFSSLIMDHDPDNLYSVISNLLDNAMKFTPSGGTIKYRASQVNNHLVIEVQDTGKGIAKTDLDKVFDRYISTDAPNNTGTGIGLALTKALVILMGGQINVESELGKGSTFRVTLPINQKAPKVEYVLHQANGPVKIFPQTISVLEQPVDTNADKPIILIIEDNIEIAELVASILTESYQIAYAEDGEKGIQKAKELIPDLIISDVMMPKRNGFEVCQTLKNNQLSSHIPIILLTAKAEQADKITGLKGRADAYLTKPFVASELLIWVDNLLNSRKILKDRYTNFTEISTSLKEKKEEYIIEGLDLDMQDEFVKELHYLFDKNLSNPNYTSGRIHLDLSIGKTQVARKIKALTTMTPGVFLRRYRLGKAKRLLMTTDMNITEVAFETGFQDASYFTRAFKETFGTTPSEFKETRVSTEK